MKGTQHVHRIPVLHVQGTCNVPPPLRTPMDLGLTPQIPGSIRVKMPKASRHRPLEVHVT
jgi:hypothetical protein